MSKISELVGDPHYTCYKPSSFNTSEMYKDMQNSCKEFRTKMSKVLNKATKILKDNEDNKDLDVFKNSIKLDTDEEDVFLNKEEFFKERTDKTVLNMNDICGKSNIMKNVDHPSHYQTKSGIEVIDVIEAFELGFNLGNVIKYVLRCGKKDADVQELEKAKWYLEREISNRKSK